MAHLLVVDDEQDMIELVSMYMENAGHTVTAAFSGDEAEAVLAQRHVDLILLDVMMPVRNGFDVCESIRTYNQVPIIFLTALGEEWDKVKAFAAGGDDYVVKPFSPGELTARIQAVLRRSGQMESRQHIIQYENIAIDTGSRIAKTAQKPVQLTMKEFDLLVLLVKGRGRTFSREELLESVWGAHYSGGTRTVDTHIKTLRMKLGESGAVIETVWGIGYRVGGDSG